MQNDYNPQFALTIETHEGVKLSHPLSADDAQILSRFAISMTPRKDVLKNFLDSVRDQPKERFLHIQKWIENILADSKSKFFTIQMESLIQEQVEIPAYLQCEPRTFKVKLNHWHEDSCELEFTVVIKCIDEELHGHNNFWSSHKSRLEENDGDIVAVILKMIGRSVFWWCYQNHSTSLHEKYGVNSIFREEGWLSDCFQITKLYFENYVDDDAFEFEPVAVEG